MTDDEFASAPHHRWEVPLIVGQPCTFGIELGVAEAGFAEQVVRARYFELFYGVDLYNQGKHDNKQYFRAVRRMLPYGNRHCLLRCSFRDALKGFKNEHFDFIYVDGYADTGEDDGKIMEDWLPKLRHGGVMAGDDYTSKYPRVIEAVNRFASQHCFKLHLMNTIPGNDAFSLHPTWFIRKH